MKMFVVAHPRPKKGISQPHACARTHEIPMGMQSDAKIFARGEMCASLLALPAGNSLQALSHACVAARKKPERSEADVTRNGKTTSYHQSINPVSGAPSSYPFSKPPMKGHRDTAVHIGLSRKAIGVGCRSPLLAQCCVCCGSVLRKHNRRETNTSPCVPSFFIGPDAPTK